MIRLFLVLIGALCTLGAVVPAHAAGETLAVVVETEEGPLPDSTVQAVIWHALYESQGHKALFLPSLDAQAVDALQGSPITTLVHMKLAWRPDSARVEREGGEVYLVGGHYPVLDTTEYALDGNTLRARYTWHTEGPISVFHVHGDQPNRFISMPEVSLQDSVTLAVQPLQAPVWKQESDRITVPVVLAADDDYRAFYGEHAWKDVAGRAVARANALLSDAGIELAVVQHETWVSAPGDDDLSSLLETLSSRPIRVRSTGHEDSPTALRGSDRALRIGFTAQTQLAVASDAEMEDVGRAYLPGRNLLIADQAAHPGHDPAWDVAEEGVAVAHEVLHALGVPHVHDDDMLMSETKRGSVYRMSPSTAELARAAAACRYTHWDAITALSALSHSAEAHLGDDLDLQLDYISDNLAYGVGVPDPGRLEPGRLSALTNVAVARYYLDQAQQDPGNAWQLRQGARAHAESALEQAPAWKEARRMTQRVAAVQPRTPRPPTTPADPSVQDIALSIDGHRSDADPGSWTLPETTCKTPALGTCE